MTVIVDRREGDDRRNGREYGGSASSATGGGRGPSGPSRHRGHHQPTSGPSLDRGTSRRSALDGRRCRDEYERRGACFRCAGGRRGRRAAAPRRLLFAVASVREQSCASTELRRTSPSSRELEESGVSDQSPKAGEDQASWREVDELARVKSVITVKTTRLGGRWWKKDGQLYASPSSWPSRPEGDDTAQRAREAGRAAGRDLAGPTDLGEPSAAPHSRASAMRATRRAGLGG